MRRLCYVKSQNHGIKQVSKIEVYMMAFTWKKAPKNRCPRSHVINFSKTNNSPSFMVSTQCEQTINENHLWQQILRMQQGHSMPSAPDVLLNSLRLSCKKSWLYLLCSQLFPSILLLKKIYSSHDVLPKFAKYVKHGLEESYKLFLCVIAAQLRLVNLQMFVFNM